MSLDPIQKNKLLDAVKMVDDIIGMIHDYVPNRHGQNAIDRFEEGIMWMNVMVNSYPMKETEVKEGEVIKSSENIAKENSVN